MTQSHELRDPCANHRLPSSIREMRLVPRASTPQNHPAPQLQRGPASLSGRESSLELTGLLGPIEGMLRRGKGQQGLRPAFPPTTLEHEIATISRQSSPSLSSPRPNAHASPNGVDSGQYSGVQRVSRSQSQTPCVSSGHGIMSRVAVAHEQGVSSGAEPFHGANYGRRFGPQGYRLGTH